MTDASEIAIARALRSLPPKVRESLATNAHQAPSELAAAYADPAFLRGAVRMLDAPARALLRLLPHLRDPLPARLLDGVAEALTGPPSNACEQLCASGLAALDDTAPPHLRTVGPILPRLSALALEPIDACEDEITPSEEILIDHLAAFRVGLALAAVEQARPRATRLDDLHRGDEGALHDLLLPAFDASVTPTDLMRLLLKQGAFEKTDGRFRLRASALDEWDDPAARLCAESIWPWRHEPGPLAVLATLADQDRWHAIPDLAERLAIASLRRAFVAGARADVVRGLTDLRHLPGLHLRERGGVTYLRLSGAARRALGFEAPRSADAPRPLLVQPNLHVVVQPGASARVIAILGRIARLETTGRAAIFAIDPEAVRRAASEGWSGSEMLSFLETHAAHGVPSTVARALADWGRAPPVAKLSRGLVVQVPPDATGWLERAGVGRVKMISPGVYLVATEHERAVIAAIKKAGLSPVDTDASSAETPGDGTTDWRQRASFVLADARKQRAWLG